MNIIKKTIILLAATLLIKCSTTKDETMILCFFNGFENNRAIINYDKFMIDSIISTNYSINIAACFAIHPKIGDKIIVCVDSTDCDTILCTKLKVGIGVSMKSGDIYFHEIVKTVRY